MKRICAWCRRSLGKTENASGEDRVITHGMCRRCESNIKFQQGVPFREFIDSLDEPILSLDSEDRIEASNRKARKIFGMTQPAIKGSKRGAVFECAYARLPEGCGKTEHCSGCAIRRTVAETFKSGKSALRVPATLKCVLPKGEAETRFLISTEKLGEVVLLRIDDVNRERIFQDNPADGIK